MNDPIRPAFAIAPAPSPRRPAPLPTTWLTPRQREHSNRMIRARNALDRELATSKGLPADDPRCARFQGYRAQDALDTAVGKARRGAPAIALTMPTLQERRAAAAIARKYGRG